MYLTSNADVSTDSARNYMLIQLQLPKLCTEVQVKSTQKSLRSQYIKPESS